jgi:hypothetical protein
MTPRIVGAFWFVVCLARTASPCQVIGPVPSAGDYVRSADVIVRATPTGYAVEAAGNRLVGPNGAPSSQVAFRVLEVLKGSAVARELTLPGRLSDDDDFNRGPVPYAWARPSSHAPCYADFYRVEAEFLLILRETSPGVLSARWAPLAPLNEQLRGSDDPWLLWVRDQLN